MPQPNAKALLAQSQYGKRSTKRLVDVGAGFNKTRMSSKDYQALLLQGSKKKVERAAANKVHFLADPHTKEIVRLEKMDKLPTRLLEHYHQCLYFQWLLSKYDDEYRSTFAVPNGGYRTKTERVAFIAEGVKSGIPDVLMLTPRGKYHGLMLEFKRPLTSFKYHSQALTAVKPEQVNTCLHFQSLGFCVAVVFGIDEAKAVTEHYLVNKPMPELFFKLERVNG
ncbi:hypothetical protein [Motilimonas eburnea]|uniref:hypothetical protein n=1 Tax=Motilimonas eburnea TaxID=1737488 RepID=UPI001E2FEC35|nr:hypothetical protein [Motilimonas eburnea]MCE2571730.1 hypothetical protein [Motilimonas eburnea]